MSRSSTRSRPRVSSAAAPPPSAQTAPLQGLLGEMRGNRSGAGSMMGANLTSAIGSLWANRTRSFLTVLGIFIGVAAVIAALTLTQGVNAYVSNLVGTLQTSIIIYPGAANKSGVSQGAGSVNTLTLNDAQSLRSVAHVTSVSPFLVTSDQTVFGNQHWTTQIEGVNADLQVIQAWQLAQGTWFSDADSGSGTAVAVLGDTVYHNLFDASGANPIGQEIRIRDQIFRVVGVLTPQGGGFSQDDVVYVPISTAQIRLKNTTTIDQVQVKVDTTADVDPATTAITDVLRQNHHIRPGHSDDFTVLSFTQALQRFGQTQTVLTALLVGIAAISLTVGGIGIMNIMLVSVTERTWEIGIRMAIGARRRDIRNQFLIEALVLCLVGGLMGLILGLLIGEVITSLGTLPFVITATTLIVPFAVSSGIALVFGIYPAILASRLDPIVAIRSDE